MDKINKIVVIEDNQDVLEAIVSILEYSGYSSKGFTRFTENAFEDLESEPISMIILDVMLSGSDGRDLARKFKNNEKTRNVPILMISAYPNVESSVLKAGADDFLQKPFGLEDLTQKVEQFVQEQSS